MESGRAAGHTDSWLRSPAIACTCRRDPGPDPAPADRRPPVRPERQRATTSAASNVRFLMPAFTDRPAYGHAPALRNCGEQLRSVGELECGHAQDGRSLAERGPRNLDHVGAGSDRRALDRGADRGDERLARTGELATDDDELRVEDVDRRRDRGNRCARRRRSRRAPRRDRRASTRSKTRAAGVGQPARRANPAAIASGPATVSRHPRLPQRQTSPYGSTGSARSLPRNRMRRGESGRRGSARARTRPRDARTACPRSPRPAPNRCSPRAAVVASRSISTGRSSRDSSSDGARSLGFDLERKRDTDAEHALRIEVGLVEAGRLRAARPQPPAAAAPTGTTRSHTVPPSRSQTAARTRSRPSCSPTAKAAPRTSVIRCGGRPFPRCRPSGSGTWAMIPASSNSVVSAVTSERERPSTVHSSARVHAGRAASTSSRRRRLPWR